MIDRRDRVPPPPYLPTTVALRASNFNPVSFFGTASLHHVRSHFQDMHVTSHMP